LWASRHFILDSLKQIRNWVQAKNALGMPGKEESAAKA